MDTHALFVTGLPGFLLLVSGLLLWFVLHNSTGLAPGLGIILSAAGALFVLIFWGITRYRKKLIAIPLNELKCICIIEQTDKNLLDGQQHVLSPIDAVHLVRKMQITSGSPELMLQWNTKSVTIVKGNPFSGGVSAVGKVLISKGIKKN